MKNIRGFILTTLFLLLQGAILLANGDFEDSGQALGGDVSYDVELADLDDDGDLDAFVANSTNNRVWINQGGAQGGSAAVFQNSGQNPGTLTSRGVALADIDDNQTVDAVVANNANGNNEVWLNSGSAAFSAGQVLISSSKDSQDAALGLLNDDTSPDLFVANNGANEVWLNNGSGSFTAAQTTLGTAFSHEVILADIDNDSDLDAYVANGTTFAQADELWINNGSGSFTAAAQTLDLDWNEGAALGDLDGDGDLDVYLATWFGDDGVWINQGGTQGGTIGTLNDSGQELSENGSTDVVLADTDNDGDLDAIVTKYTGQANEVWINNGSGQFSDSGQELDDSATYGVATGDLDLDGDPDLFFANFGANSVWLQGGLGLPGVWFDVDTRQGTAGLPVYPWTQPGDASLPVVLGFGSPDPLTISAEIASNSGVHTQILGFAAGQAAGELTIPNPAPVISASATISLTVQDNTTPLNDQIMSRLDLGSTADLVNPLQLVFINRQNGPTGCTLCMIDWVLKQIGFEPSFWQLHHLSLEDLRDSLSWSHYMTLFQSHQGDLTMIILTHPALLWETYDVLQAWTPGITATDDGQGAAVLITAQQAQGAQNLLNNMADAANPRFAQTILVETAALDIPALAGQNMEQAFDQVENHIQDQIFLPITARGS